MVEAVAKIKAYEASNPFSSPTPPLPGQKIYAQRSGRPAAGGGRCEPSQRRRSRSAQPSVARAGETVVGSLLSRARGAQPRRVDGYGTGSGFGYLSAEEGFVVWLDSSLVSLRKSYLVGVDRFCSILVYSRKQVDYHFGNRLK